MSLRRRAHGLFDRLCEPAHLLDACRRTVRGKRQRPDVAAFLLHRDARLMALSEALRRGDWRPGGFDRLRVFDPKPRIITRAPIADRVLHTALVDVIAPVFARSLMPEDFACRPGFGCHRAVLRLKRALRAHRFAIHLDIRAFFPSVDLTIARRLLGERIDDARLLALVDLILTDGQRVYADAQVRRFARLTSEWPPPGRGLPIGSSVSQFVATHVYLMGLDHFIKRTLRVPAYVRYGDDLVLFGDTRADLRGWRAAVGEWLWNERGLRLKHPNARVLSGAGHLDALGYRITRTQISALGRPLRRLGQRVAEALDERPTPRMAQSIASTAGVVLFGC